MSHDRLALTLNFTSSYKFQALERPHDIRESQLPLAACSRHVPPGHSCTIPEGRAIPPRPPGMLWAVRDGPDLTESVIKYPSPENGGPAPTFPAFRRGAGIGEVMGTKASGSWEAEACLWVPWTGVRTSEHLLQSTVTRAGQGAAEGRLRDPRSSQMRVPRT